MTCRQWVDGVHIECNAWTDKISAKCGASIACQFFVSFVNAACLVWSSISKLVCVAWDGIRCASKVRFGIRRRDQAPVKHVFVLMLENRAFDHMLGFSGITGTDIDTGRRRAVNGAAGTNDFQGTAIPPSIEASFKLSKPADVDPGHEFANTVVALCGPGAIYPDGGPYPPINNSGFIANYAASRGAPEYPPNIMKCYSSARVPIINALAREFALCDAWFSSLPGPTWPNRFFMHAASSGGLDDSPSGMSAAGNIAFGGYTFDNGTIFKRLDDACLEWRVFAGDSFPATLALSGMVLAELEGRIHDLDDFAAAVNDPNFSTAYTFIEPDYGHDIPPGSEDFVCGTSQHPLDDITRGERLIKDVYETIRNSPHWNDSLLVVTYDEHGGFYDHVPPPPAVPPGDCVRDEDNVFHRFTFDRLGVRVPAVVISPLIEKNVLDGAAHDHTAVLATIEAIFGLKPLTRRDAAASTVLNLLTRSTPRDDAPTEIGLPATSGFTCEAAPRRAEASGLAAGRAGREGYDWTRDTEPVSPALRGFQEVALLKALKSARGRDRAQIRKEYLAANTEGGAKHFIHKVAQMTAETRIPASQASRLGFRSSVRRPPVRRWVADPVALYRRPAGDDASS